MAVEIRHSGETVVVRSRIGLVSVISPAWRVGVSSGILSGDGTPYAGSYEATPTMAEQVLPTRSKTMHDDVTVHAIPFTQTSNPSGGYTAIIAAS